MKLKKRPSTIIGVDKYTIFRIADDDTTGIHYDDVTSIPGTVSIASTDSGGTDVFSADNGAYEVSTYVENRGHELVNADIPPEVDAMLRGLELENGGMLDTGEEKTEYFGTAWRITKGDNTHRYVKYFKGAFALASSVGGETKNATGAPNRQTAKMTYSAVMTEYTHNGKPLVSFYIDEDQIPIGGSGDGSFASLDAFEKAFFSDMATLIGDTAIVTDTVTE